jgi:hypothetical protein
VAGYYDRGGITGWFVAAHSLGELIGDMKACLVLVGLEAALIGRALLAPPGARTRQLLLCAASLCRRVMRNS